MGGQGCRRGCRIQHKDGIIMTYLEFLIAEAMGRPPADPGVVAAVKALSRVVDHDAIKREMIRRDKETDYKILTRRYGCSPQTVYRAWAEILPS